MRAWVVMRCVAHHLNSNLPYDGWKYNFRSSKLTPELYMKNVHLRLQYGFHHVEREFPTDNDLIKFWYPLFRLSYAKVDMAVRFGRTHYAQMKHFIKYIETKLPDEEEPTFTIDANGLPSIYNRSKKSMEEYFLVVAMFLKFPSLNKLVFNDPLNIYSTWLEQVHIDRRFISLYISKDLVCSH